MTSASIHRVLDPRPVDDLAAYIADGGGIGLANSLELDLEQVITVIEQSGLRGRGGAGFPTGRKWRSIGTSGSPNPTVVVNAAEGEPGTFKDRAILRGNPYRVLEGALIAAAAFGSSRIVVAIKGSFVDEIARLDTAVAEIAAAGWSTDITIDVVRGPGEYLFGEETALLEVVDGRQPFPRVAPPYRRGLHDGSLDGSLSGDRDSVTNEPAVLVDNVETLANVPGILANGADWFRSVGTAQSPGTIVCTVTGDTNRHGVAEFAMGTPLATVLDVIGGGIVDGRAIMAVLTGVSSPILDPGALTTALTYEDMSAMGSGLGSGSFIVVDDQHSLHEVVAGVARFLSVESCGQCSPCKGDGLAIADALRSRSRLDEIDDHLRTITNGARCALAGQVEQIVGASIDRLRADLTSHTTDDAGDDAGDVTGSETDTDTVVPYPIVPLVDIVNGRAVYDMSFLDKRADWSYVGEGPDSSSWPAQHLENQPVSIGSPHVREGDGGLDGVVVDDSVEPDPFASIRSLERDVEAELAAARELPAEQRAPSLARLRRHIQRHSGFMSGIVYPLLERLDVDGDDLSWYPQFHEQHALRLLGRLAGSDTESGTESGVVVTDRMLHDIASDLHLAVIEANLRVLPALTSALRDDPDETRRVVGAISTMLG